MKVPEGSMCLHDWMQKPPTCIEHEATHVHHLVTYLQLRYTARLDLEAVNDGKYVYGDAWVAPACYENIQSPAKSD